MKRENLLERIDKLKQVMPWYVLEYYQSKLAVPYSFTTLYEYLKEYDRFFSWVLESGISNADKMSDISLSVLENISKKDMESFILTYVNVLCSMPIRPKMGFLKQPLTVPFLHFLVFISIWLRKLKTIKESLISIEM